MAHFYRSRRVDLIFARIILCTVGGELRRTSASASGFIAEMLDRNEVGELDRGYLPTYECPNGDLNPEALAGTNTSS